MDRKKTRICLYSLGCKVNGYETERMTEEFREAGYQIVPPFDVADVYIINTCTVTNIADRKSRKMLRHAAKANPDAVVVAAGCYVDAEKQFGAREADEQVADLWVVNKEKENIVAIVEKYLENRGKVPQAGEKMPEEENESLSAEEEVAQNRERQTDQDHGKKGDRTRQEETKRAGEQGDVQTDGHTRVYLKIQDGCNQFCSYCIIPFARGRVVSRRPEEVLAETRRLSEAGYREIVLTGIHISSYGLDFRKTAKESEDPASETAAVNFEEYRGEEKEYAAEPAAKSREEERTEGGEKAFDLIDLVREICQVPGIDRVRLGSMEPRIVTEENIRILAGLKKVCPHFHLSLQSGCDATLRRMNRHYTAAEYLEKCEIIRRFFPDAAITTDVIVGFPGETEEEFEATKAFLAKVRFARMHIFKYSARRGTRAAAMDHQIPEPVKDARSAALRKLNLKMEEEYARSFIGKIAEVLFEETVETSAGERTTGDFGALPPSAAAPYLGQEDPGVKNMRRESTAREWVGHTTQYLRVSAVTEKDVRNQILPVRLTEVFVDGGEVRMRGRCSLKE